MANLRFVNLRREALRKAFGSEPTNRSANFRRRPNLHVLALSASRYNLGTRCVAGSGSFWAFPRARRQAGRRRVATTLRSPPIRRGVPVQKESVSPGRVVVVGGVGRGNQNATGSHTSDSRFAPLTSAATLSLRRDRSLPSL